jgi:hypothetical protein
MYWFAIIFWMAVFVAILGAVIWAVVRSVSGAAKSVPRAPGTPLGPPDAVETGGAGSSEAPRLDETPVDQASGSRGE